MPDVTTNYGFEIPLTAETENIAPSQWRSPIGAIDARIKLQADDLNSALNAGQADPNKVYSTAEMGIVAAAGFGGISSWCVLRRGMCNIVFGITRTGANLTAPASGDFDPNNILLANYTKPELDPLMTYGGGLQGGHAGCMFQGTIWNRGIYMTCTSPNLVIGTNDVIYLYGMYPTAVV